MHIGILYSFTYEHKFELEPVVRASSSSSPRRLSGSHKCNLTLQFLINPSQARLVYFKFFGGVLGCLFLRSCLKNNTNNKFLKLIYKKYKNAYLGTCSKYLTYPIVFLPKSICFCLLAKINGSVSRPNCTL